MHKCRIDKCRGKASGPRELCVEHRQMQMTIRRAQREPLPRVAIEAFLAALECGHGEGETTPAAYRGAPGRADTRTAPRSARKRGAA